MKCCDQKISERKNITQIVSDHSYTLKLGSLTAGMTTCPTCGVWVSKTRLGQHTQRQHTSKYNGRNYQCNQCGKLSQCKEALSVHISKYHKTLPASQSIWMKRKKECLMMSEVRNEVPSRIAKSVSVPCSKYKSEIKGLKCHDRDHDQRANSKASVFCPKCQYYFPLSHLRRKHPEICQETLHKCQLCDKQFLSQVENVKHLETEHACPICKTIFSSRKGIEAHVREMHKECVLAGRQTNNIKRPEHLTESSDDDLAEAELYLDTLCGKCGSHYKKLRLHKQVCQIRPHHDI